VAVVFKRNFGRPLASFSPVWSSALPCVQPAVC